MEGFLDRLAEVLKSLFRDGESAEKPRGSPRFSDPDVSDAWEELDDFLGAGKSGGRQRAREGSRGPAQGARDDDLRQDYANLEVPFGADIEEVKRAYKTLIMRYHPDKHAEDPEKLRIATEITKKVNESFERIRTRTESSRDRRA
jgi:hypothetical protein